ncbi:YceD family protein [Roseobacteraceae bacterium S113]
MQHSPSRYARAVSGLSQNAATAFDIQTNEAARAEIARELGFDAVRKLTLSGDIRASGRADWELVGKLGATIVQPCVVTLEPVVTRIDVPVQRRYLSRWEDQTEAGAETEMPEDDTLEPLGTHIDPYVVMLEALALAAPDFPRAADAAPLEDIRVTEPGKTAMTDEEIKPFAGLAALKAQLEGKDDS